MKNLKIVLIAAGVLIGISIMITGINIFQNGGSYKGESIQQILSVSPEKATIEDIKKLDKARIFQLFYAAAAPDFSEINGEYHAENLDVGIMAVAANFYTHNFFGPGRWSGKAFKPINADKGAGYNIFTDKPGGKIFRTRKMDTFIGKSLINDKPSFHVVYSAYNGGTVHSMRDELRKINDNLYIGMGHMAIGGGSINPAPFVVTGPAKKWAGADDDIK